MKYMLLFINIDSSTPWSHFSEQWLVSENVQTQVSPLLLKLVQYILIFIKKIWWRGNEGGGKRVTGFSTQIFRIYY